MGPRPHSTIVQRECGAKTMRARGAVSLAWQTALDNTRAQALYERMGARRSQWLDYDLRVATAKG